MNHASTGCCGFSRRAFLMGGTGVALGGSLALVTRNRGAARPRDAVASFIGKTSEVAKPTLAMPGPFPGRVIEVNRPGAVRAADYSIDPDAVQAMMARGMCELTGTGHPVEAWRRFFEPGDVVGIKVNPVGRKPNKGEGWRKPIGSISSAEVVLETVAGLKSAGVRASDIIVFERYAKEFRETKFNGTDCGYLDMMRSRQMDGVRWYASSAE